MKKKIWNDSYKLINIIFAGIILAVFAYSLYYGGERIHPVPSASELLTGETSISTGLSRSFSAIIRFDFEKARSLNPYGIRIFLCFLVQLFMRFGGFFLGDLKNRQNIIIADILLSALIFIILFWPFLIAVFQSS